MAKALDTETYKDCSEIRPGMKREFTMMMNQPQFLGLNSRTRSSRSSSSSGLDRKQRNQKPKRVNCKLENAVKVDEELKSESVDKMSDSGYAHGTGLAKAKTKFKVKSSRRFIWRKIPNAINYLLETGLLEGKTVTYWRGPKVRRRKRDHLPDKLKGIIKGTNVQCSCSVCKGAKDVTPITFEIHAGSLNRKPADHMYLENGRRLRDIMNACQGLRVDAVEKTILRAIGGSSKEKADSCQTCNARSVLDAGDGGRTMLCGYCMVLKKSKPSSRQQSDTIDRSVSLSNVKPSEGKANGNSTRSKGRGRPSRKDLKMRKSELEAPDDFCSICLDEGNLLSCDLLNCTTCRRSFHRECLSTVPTGEFRCKYCTKFSKDKSARQSVNDVARNDPMEQTTQRSASIGGDTEAEIERCVLCRGDDFIRPESGFAPRAKIICVQCKKEYHKDCLNEHNIADLTELPVGDWLCSIDCNKIHSALKNLVADGERKISDTFLNFIKKKHEEKGSRRGHLDIKWRLLHRKLGSDKHLLNKALHLFHDRFGAMEIFLDKREVDLLPHMVHGRNLVENKVEVQDFEGLFCAILTVNSSVVCACLFRIFGKEVAELPVVATTIKSQRLGYFQVLFSCIVNILRSHGIKNLVLPAATKAKEMWTKKFGFKKITQEQMNEFVKDYHLVEFQGTTMLHKAVHKT